jgi:glycosyltransferase involved in cell wall biosynthesis
MPAPLRIGVNALFLIPGEVGGTEIYLRNLLTNRETGAQICPQAPNFQPLVTRVPGRLRPARLLWEQTGLAAESFSAKMDVLFSPGFTSPLLCHGRKVTVIHDLQHKRQPANFGFLERCAWNALVWASVRTSRLLITVSESSRRDLIEIYRVKPQDVRLIRHGVEQEFFGLRTNNRYSEDLLRQADVPPCRYLLAASTLHPHKNWTRLLEAYEHLVNEGRPEHLVVTGLRGKASDDVQRMAQQGPLASRVHVLGWQPRNVLLACFKFAEALVFPSTFEGFGMPVAEAMAAGIPVACSDIAPLREIAEDAALFFEPGSTPAIADALRSILDEPELRSELVDAGRERAKNFQWTRAAEQTLEVLLEAARG